MNLRKRVGRSISIIFALFLSYILYTSFNKDDSFLPGSKIMISFTQIYAFLWFLIVSLMIIDESIRHFLLKYKPAYYFILFSSSLLMEVSFLYRSILDWVGVNYYSPDRYGDGWYSLGIILFPLIGLLLSVCLVFIDLYLRPLPKALFRKLYLNFLLRYFFIFSFLILLDIFLMESFPILIIYLTTNLFVFFIWFRVRFQK